MTIFRAVRLDRFDPNAVHIRHSSQRLPGNVPYLVDNLWEFTRPEGKPSRWHAVYASPTPELTLAGANPGGSPSHRFVACRVAFRTPAQIFQLSVPDARYHPDVKNLQRLVHDRLANWGGRGLECKTSLAPLFLPGTTREELSAAMKSNLELQVVVEEVASAVTMWWDAPEPLVGEIIFEIEEDNAYTLQQV